MGQSVKQVWEVLTTRPILVLLVSLSALAGLYWLLAWRDDVNLAKARESEAKAILARNEQQKIEEQARLERAAHEEERKQWQEQIASLSRSILTRNEATERRIAAAIAPKPAAEVSKDAEQTFGHKPTQTAQGFTVSVQEMQEFVALKIDRDRLDSNLKETTRQLDIERQTTSTLRADLERAVKSLEQANNVIDLQRQTIDAYKKAATKTKLRRALEFGGRAAMTAGLAYLGARAAQ